MARDRVAMILESMAAKKSLRASHYRIYLCVFSAIQEGKDHTVDSICDVTGMHLRTVQRALKELMKTGNVTKTDEGFICLNFWSGFPAKAQTDKPVASDVQSCRLGAATQSAEILKKEKKENKTYLTKNLNIGSDRADPRFQELVDGLFEVYEEIIKEKLNPLYKNSDGAMIKRMLKRLPEEKVERFLEAWKNFLWTSDDWDAGNIKQSPVRYWATRVTKFFPKKQFDVVESYRRKYGKKENE